MTIYSGDEFYGDDITSGPAHDVDFDAERQDAQDEYDRTMSDRDWWDR